MRSMIIAIAAVALATGCKEASTNGHDHDHDGGDSHTHDDGTTHDDHGHDEGGDPAGEHANDNGGEADDDDHGHDHADEVSLGTATIGDMEVELAQGHGAVEAGTEGHLVVKLPYSDDGETIVRAWIGTEDRTLSRVGLGEYAASHDDYDIHAMAPDPLPEGAMWWIEIEKPDGTKVVGSANPKLEAES